MPQSIYVPAPSTWSPGEPVQAPVLRADVSGAIQLLSRPPLFIGSQTFAAQAVKGGDDTPVQLDTETADSVSGHRVTATGSPPVNTFYYGMFPGWYLCEGTAALNYTGGAGSFTVGFQAQQAGAVTTRYGMKIPNTSGSQSVVSASRLVKMVNTGTFGGGSNDYVSLFVNQDANADPATQPLGNGSGRLPVMSVTWVGALSGTAPLAVPPLAAWPVPPAYITSAFLNANVRDAIGFLIYPPLCEYTLQVNGSTLASQSSTPPVGTAVALTSKTVDNYSAYAPLTSTWTAPVGGVYYAYGQVAIVSATTTVCVAAGLTVISANYGSGSALTLWGGATAAYNVAGQASCAIVRRILRLNAGDTVQLAGLQDDSGSAGAVLLGTGNYTSRLITIWRGK